MTRFNVSCCRLKKFTKVGKPDKLKIPTRWGGVQLKSRILASLVMGFMILMNIMLQVQANSEFTGEVEAFLAPRYSEVVRSYESYFYTGVNIIYPIADLVSDDRFITTNVRGSASEIVLDLQRHDQVNLYLEVEEAGVYAIAFDYFDYRDSMLNIEFSLRVNNRFLYRELSRLQFESNWEQSNEISLDRYGHQIVPTPSKVFYWNQQTLTDSSYRHSGPLGFSLEAGVNVLTIEVNEGSFLLGDLTLKAPGRALATYTDNEVNGDQIIVIEAQEMTTRNDSSIRAGAEFNVDLTPYDTHRRVLNLLDGWSFKDPGQRVDYTFYVEEAGYYHIAFSYRQDFRIDFPTFREIHLNGEIPNDQLLSYAFPFTRQLEHLVVTDEASKNHMTFYLEAGENTLSLVVNIDPIRHVIERVDDMLVEINEFDLQVNRLSGSRRDRYRTIDIERFIPDAKTRLEGWANELDELYDSIRSYSSDVRRIGAFSQLEMVATQLRSLAKYPNRIPRRIGQLSEGTSSVTALLATLNQDLTFNPLTLDKIFITQCVDSLPNRAGLFRRTVESVRRFVNSFTDEAYSPNQRNPEHLQVWINRPRQYVEIIQQMADEYFTPETGIAVYFSLMPDQNRLILANASGDAPDVAASVHFTMPFELGIRDAVVDLTQFADFEEVVSVVPEGLLIPSIIGEGIYSIPETKNFFVFFYREDVLDALNIPVPNTMEEVTAVLPELQRLGMNFFHPAAGMFGLKHFGATMPLIYQNNGAFYGETVLNTTIDAEEAITGIRQLTELFTLSNIPYEVPSFYQHFRSGTLPIGIADYGMYNLLLNAAPELANLWNIALIPGVENEVGQVLRYSAGGAESLIIFESSEKQEEAWAYLKWWTSTEVQTKFGQRLQTTYGQEFLWNTANLEAFANLPWNSNHRDVIIEQSRWLKEAPRVPGSYMLERELSNAFISIVLEGENPRRAIDLAVKRTNRETLRKLEEFGFIQNGEVITPYITPNIELSIVKEEGYEEK